MPKSSETKVGGSSGATLVEFAFVLPILLLILLGALEMGRILFIRIAVTNAARAGVQYGAQSDVTAQNFDGMQSAAETDFGGMFGLSLSFKLDGGPTTPCSYYSCWDGAAEHNQTGCTRSSPSPPSCSGGDRTVQFVRVDTTVDCPTLFHYPGFPASFEMTGHAVRRVP
jgi:Flp pilus assembly protein TadG